MLSGLSQLQEDMPLSALVIHPPERPIFQDGPGQADQQTLPNSRLHEFIFVAGRLRLLSFFGSTCRVRMMSIAVICGRKNFKNQLNAMLTCVQDITHDG